MAKCSDENNVGARINIHQQPISANPQLEDGSTLVVFQKTERIVPDRVDLTGDSMGYLLWKLAQDCFLRTYMNELARRYMAASSFKQQLLQVTLA